MREKNPPVRRKVTKQFDTTAARALATGDPTHPHWTGQMRQTLEWACDIIDAANAALEPKRTDDYPHA
jgi:hypothetical protein